MNKPIINGLLISAGLSERMGEFKPLMNYEGIPFIVLITKKMLQVCDNVIIVTGFKDDEVNAILNSKFSIQELSTKISVVYNPNFEKGMFTSLQAGLTALKDSDWILYHFVDQPFFTEIFYQELTLQMSNDFDWIQPVYNGKEGHPVMFNKRVCGMIDESPSDSQLRLIRDRLVVKKKKWDCNYPQVLIDFDTKEDLEKFFSNQ